MNPTPKRKLQEILDSLSSLIPGEVSDFELNKYRIEAKSLLKSNQADAADGYMIMGALATFKGDEQGMRSNHQNAIKLLGGSTLSYLNYAASLSRMGFYLESYEHFENAYKAEQDNLMTLHSLIKASVKGGGIHRALQLTKKWDKLSPEKSTKLIQIIIDASDIVCKYNVTDEEIIDLISISTSILQGKGVYPYNNVLEIENDVLIFNLMINVPIEEAEKLENCLDSKLKGMDLSSHVLVTYVSNDPIYSKFVDFIDEQMTRPETLVKANKNLLDQIDELVEGVELD